MKSFRIVIAGLVMFTGAIFAQAHESNSGDTIVVNCPAGLTPYMADVTYALEHSRYFATSAARREMLTLARQACASGSTKVVAFAPAPDQRYATISNTRSAGE